MYYNVDTSAVGPTTIPLRMDKMNPPPETNRPEPATYPGSVVPVTTLTEQIAYLISLDILSRRLAPGTRLRELELAKQFKASRPVIREALQRLKIHALVDDAPWKGAFVVRFTREELVDLFEIRAVVFQLVARWACERATTADLDDFDAAVEQMSQAARIDIDAQSYETLRNVAHRRLTQATGSASELNRRIGFSTRLGNPYSIESVRTPEQRRQSATRWRKLLALVRTRNAREAAAYALEMNTATAVAALDAFDRLLVGPDWAE